MKEIIIGIFFITVGLLFCGISLTYKIGTLSNMGPGYYPLILSVALIVLGIVNILREVIYGHT